MALVECPECGHDVSDHAVSCPKCAFPLATVAVPKARALKSRGIETSVKRHSHRLWFAVFVVAALIAAPFAPDFTLWFGIILLVLCVTAFIPVVQDFSRRILRINASHRWRSGFRVTVYGLIGFVLIYASRAGVEYKEEWERAEARSRAEKFERRQLISEANTQVVAIVREAELAWKDGDSALAEKKLESASEVANASDSNPILQLRIRMANAKVEALVLDAISDIKASDIDAAREKVQAALAVPHASTLADASKLKEQIGYATDPSRIRTTLMELSDEAFEKLQEDVVLPKQLVTGYAGLDNRITSLAITQLADIASAREQRRQEQIERKRAAAEAASIAKERRRVRVKRREEERERRLVPLVVENWSWRVEHGYAISEGEVTNRSNSRLENVQVVVSFYTEGNQFITSSDAIVEYNPILPAQTTPFKVHATHNPQMSSARLDFKHLFGGSIGYKKR